MALTKAYKTTIIARIRRDPEFANALLEEALSSFFVEGDKGTALALLRDLIHAFMTFESLSRETKLPEKSLHRMFGPRGNPRIDNLANAISALRTAIERANRQRLTLAIRSTKARPSRVSKRRVASARVH
jgi:DNA-binding phage protein